MQATPSLSQEELALFNELFSGKFGIHYPEHKREILESRLLPRLRANHLQRFIDYYLLLQYDLDRELDALTRAITNNESYFFRETTQFDALCQSLEELKAGGLEDRLRFLSAGCSSGEEPYTLNIVLRDQGYGLQTDELRIDAVDLDSQRLEQARAGVYRHVSLRALDDAQTQRLFTRTGEEEYRLKDPFRCGVHFASGNILDPLSFAPLAYDAVFCRNVLIYFTEAALKKAIDNFARIVRQDGLLFLGHSESIIGLTKAFQAERLGNCIAYRRKEDV
ncbi:MAG: protein-glutamate O-methyltransferase CheR [Thermoanaerobaculia bacterium]|nr:protein-glutamate O-methyltransferase CheR [Thermoanaerobaculia bacterium]